MTVNTRSARGRRPVRYESLDELLQDAETLTAGEVETVGNWSQGQILQHLAATMNCSIDGFPSQLPRAVRWLVRLLFKRRFLSRTLPSGFRIPKAFSAALQPPEVNAEAGLASLRNAVSRLRGEDARAPHPALGELTNAEWDRLHCRHAELHMSFVVPRPD